MNVSLYEVYQNKRLYISTGKENTLKYIIPHNLLIFVVQIVLQWLLYIFIEKKISSKRVVTQDKWEDSV